VPADSTAIDASVRSHDDGRTLLGGSPLRLLRLTDAGAAIVEAVRTTGSAPPGPAAAALVRRLFGTGMAHPIPGPRSTADADLCMVVPVRDDADGLAALLRAQNPSIPVVIVDDGSNEPVTLAPTPHVTVLRNAASAGPAAARNRGWRSVDAELIAFVDADVEPEANWLANLLGHFDDPEVAAVAPRVRASAGPSTLERYEQTRSPLDLGPELGRVQPRSRIAYVPTAALVVRRSVLEQLDGFDESMRVGEDVDFVWRVHKAGHGIRYEPRSIVSHRPRPSWVELLKQRQAYGSAAAALDIRHPGNVAPAELNAWSLAAWLVPVAFGRRGIAAGAAVAAASTAVLRPRLVGRVDNPTAESLRLAGRGNLFAGRLLAHATTRAWAPIALAASFASRRVRLATTAAAVVPAALEWQSSETDLDPVRFITARIADDLAYCTGVWQGVLRTGRWRALLPRLTGIPGVTTAVSSAAAPTSHRSRSATPPEPTDQSRNR